MSIAWSGIHSEHSVLYVTGYRGMSGGKAISMVGVASESGVLRYIEVDAWRITGFKC